LTISPGSTYTNPTNNTTELLGTLNNEGTLQVNGGGGPNGILDIGDNVTLTGGGTVNLAEGSGGGSPYIRQTVGGLTLTNVNNTIEGAGIIGNDGLTLVNDTGGTLLANVSGQTLFLNGGGAVTNNGTMEVNPGSTMQVSSGTPLTNFSGTTLTGGIYIINGAASSPGTLAIFALGTAGGEIVNNAAAITLNGPNSSFEDASGLNALSNLAANKLSTSSFTVEGGQTFTTNSSTGFSNAGTVTVGSGSTINVGAGGTRPYTQTGGITTINGTLSAAATTIDGGTLDGTGTVNGPVTLPSGGTGVVVPGTLGVPAVLPAVPGTLTVNGTYTQHSGTFTEEILNGSATGAGMLNLTSGNVVLGGTAQINITLLNGFTPADGETFTIMTDASGTVSGAFANAPASTEFVMDGFDWTIAYDPPMGNVVLDAVAPVGSGPIKATGAPSASSGS